MIGQVPMDGEGFCPGRAAPRRLFPGTAAAGALMLAAPAAADGPGFAPGGWEHATKMISAVVPGVPSFLIRMFAGDRSRRSCLTPQQAATAPQALLTQDDAASCRMRRFVQDSGHFDYVTFCINKRFPEGLTIASAGPTPRRATPCAASRPARRTGGRCGS